MNHLKATNAAKATSPYIKIWPKPSPIPSELANQAKPKPAASPPNMAPQGRFGGAAGAVPFGFAAAAVFGATVPGATGVASRCATFVDCLPTDFPPLRRLPACASRPDKPSMTTKTKDQIFMFAPENSSYPAIAAHANFNT